MSLKRMLLNVATPRLTAQEAGAFHRPPPVIASTRRYASRCVGLVLAAVLYGFAGGAGAASSLYWSANGTSQGGAGTWDTTNQRWGAVPGGPFGTVWNNANNDTAIFGSTAGAVTLGGNVTVGGLTFNDNSGYSITQGGASATAVTFGVTGTISNNVDATLSAILLGNVQINKAGTGKLTLQAASGRTGTFQIDAGTLRIENATAFGTTTAPITINNTATLELGGSVAITVANGTGAVALNNGGTMSSGLAGLLARMQKTINVANSATVTFDSGGNSANILSINDGASSRLAGGTGSKIQIKGSGTVRVGDSNARTTAIAADWYLQGGKFSPYVDAQLGSGGLNDIYFQGGTFAPLNATTLGASRVLDFSNAAGGTIDTAVGNFTLGTAGQLSGANRLTKAGANSLIISADNSATFSGPLTLNVGTVQAGHATALGSGDVTFTGGTLQYTAASAGTDWATRFKSSTSAIKLDVNGQNVTLAGIIDSSNTGGLTLSATGGGTLTLSGAAANTFSGLTTVSGGTLLLSKSGGAQTIGTGGLTINGTGQLDFNGVSDTIGNVTIAASGATGNTTPILNTAGGGTLTIGTLGITPVAGFLSQINTVGTGGAGTLKLGGTVTFTAVTTGQAKISGKLDLGAATRTFTVNLGTGPAPGYDLEIDAAISGEVGSGITRSGGTAGTLVLSGANTFDGNVSVVGTLVLANNQACGSPSITRTWTVGNAATLALRGGITIGYGAGLGSVTWSIRGTGDSRLGTTPGGLVNISGNNSAPCAISLAAGTTIGSLTVGDKLTLTGGISGTYALTVAGAGDVELGGAITTTTGTLTNNIGGTLTLSGAAANTFSGLTTANSGTLVLNKLNGGNAVNAIAGGGLTINAGAVVRYAASTTNPDMMGTGGVAINGTGQLDFNGASDTIGNVAIVATGTAANTTPIRNTAGLGTLTIGTLGITPEAGYTNRIDTGTGTLRLGGTVTFTAATTGQAQISGNVDVGSATRTLTVNHATATPYDLLIDANISSSLGAYGLTLDGAGTVWLTGSNSFTGTLTLQAGTLKLGTGGSLASTNIAVGGSGATLNLTAVDVLPDNSRLTVAAGGVVQLDAGVAENIGSLALNGVEQTGNKTYGSSTSGADVQNDTYFSGTGKLLVSMGAQAAVPAIVNSDVTAVTTNSATFNGLLTSAGSPPADVVYVLWGTDTNAWTSTNSWTGSFSNNQPFSTNLALLTDKTYYYTFGASNTTTNVVATGPKSLITGLVQVEATTNTAQYPSSNGTFTISRPAGCTNIALTVPYTLSGSAVSNLDYTLSSWSSVTLAPGQTSQVVTVTALNDNDTTNEHVVLTLSAGANYPTGAMNSATVTIAPRAPINYTWDGGPGGTGTNWNNSANWNPDGLPAAGDTAEINWTNGTSVIADGIYVAPGITLVTVRAGNTLGNGAQQINRGGGLLNEGTIENSPIYSTTYTVTNAGIIQANGAGKTETFTLQGMTVNNSGGTIRAINGGTLVISYGTITNGLFFIDNTSTQLTSGASSTLPLNFNNVTVTNNGTVNLQQSSSGAGNRDFFFDLNTGTKYNNYGTISIVQNWADTGSTGNKRLRLYVTNGASFHNNSSGILTISQLMTSNPSNSTYETYFRMDASGFTNNGTINVTTLTNSVGTAQFRAPSVDFANAGTITVDGPFSSIQMSNRTLTQTAGLLTVTNGGSVVAASVQINGGTLKLVTGGWLASTNIVVDGSGAILNLTSTNALPDNARLTVAAGGVVQLDAGVEEKIGSLALGGVEQTDNMTYGSSASGADVTNDTYFTGTGKLLVNVHTVIVNTNVTAVTTNSATFNGLLVSKGSPPADVVYVLWGTDTNAWTSANSWSGSFTNNQPFGTNIALETDKTYYYTFGASNTTTNVVATGPQSLITGLVRVQATAATAQYPGTLGQFTISRPAGCTNIAVTVPYTLSGSAVSNVDYTLSSWSSVTLDPGQTSQVVTVTALSDGDTTNEQVVLTLSAGANYPTGAMNSATVTIAPADTSGVPPGIQNADVTAVTTNSATFNGLLVSTGSPPADVVYVLWGTDTNAWTSANSWTGSFSNNQPFSTNIALETDKTYYYTFGASNTTTNVVAAGPKSLITGLVQVEATTNTAQYPSSNGTFTISRPAGCTNMAVTVPYTLSGSAVSNVDYTLSSWSSVTLAPGQTSQVVTVTALNDNDTTNEHVVLTLSAGANYPTGAMNSATVTIAPRAPINYTWDGGPGGTGTNWNNAANWNPDGLPAAGDTAEINWTNGTSVIADGAYVAPGITLVTVRAGNTLGNGAQQINRGGGLLNEGTIENAPIYSTTYTVTNTGIIQAGGTGKTMTFTLQGMTINNSGGTIRAINGGTLVISYGTITNGLFFIDNTSTQLTSGASSTLPLNFNNVTVTNNGTVNLQQSSSGAGNRDFFFDLNTGTKYNNYGTISIVQNWADTGSTGNKRLRLYVTNGASFHNNSSGILTISQLMTSNPNSSTYETYFRMDASGFTNNGTINVTTLTNSVGTAQFRAPSVDFANAGTITIDGPFSSIQMTNRTLIQTAGLLTVTNGGSVVATNVQINGGTLKLGSGGTNALPDSAWLTVAAGGVVQLDAGIQEDIGALVLNGVQQAGNTTYGSSVSGADVTNDTYFAGTGLLRVDMGLRAPAITNSAVTAVTTNSATFNGLLTVAGTPLADVVYVLWGTDTNAWAYTNWWTGSFTNNQPFSTNVTFAPGQTYYYTFGATNTTTNVVASPPVSFGPPAVTISNASGIGIGTATLNGRLITSNGLPTAVFFCWGTNDGYVTGSTSEWPNVVACGSVTNGQSFSNNLAGLTYGQRYWYRVHATNASGPAWSSATNFLTTVPTGIGLTNAGPTSVTSTSAMLNATLTGSNSTWDVYAYWGQANGTNNPAAWGTNAYVGTYTLIGGVAATNIGYWASTGIVGSATNYYTFMASNAATNRWASPSLFFGAPVVTVSNASGIGVGTATLNGRLMTSNGLPTAVFFCWGTNDGYVTGSTSEWPNVVACGTATNNQLFTTNLTGLTYGQRYWYRAHAANDSGVAWSAPTNFLTTAATGTGLTNAGPTSVTSTSAMLNATLTGSNSTWDVYAYWGQANGTNNPAAWGTNAYVGTYTLSGEVAGTNIGYWASTGIVGSATNYYTFMASNAATNRWASPSMFFGAPVVTVSNASGIGVGTATLNGRLMTSNGLPTAVFFCWGTNDGYVTGSTSEWPNVVACGSATNNQLFTTNLTGLTYGQRYWYRAHATNDSGVAWSAPTNFLTTAATGTGLTNAGPTSVTSTSALLNATLTGSNSTWDVYAYWGQANGTNNPAAWGTNAYVGTYTLTGGVASTNIGYWASTGIVGSATNYYTFMASNAATNRWASPSLFFGAPVVTVSNATVGVGTATLNGRLVTSNGLPTAVFFCWGTNDGYVTGSTSEWPNVVACGTATNNQLFTTTLTGLTYGQRYWYRAHATNDSGVAWSAPTNFLTTAATGTGLTNAGPTSVTSTSAMLNATLTGSNSTWDVYAYWGQANGTNNPAAWGTNAYVGTYTLTGATTSTNIACPAAVAADAGYWYTFSATNAATNLVASPSPYLITGEVTVQAPDSIAQYPYSNGTFMISRPATCTNGSLTVPYTLSGSAVSNMDYTLSSWSSVTLDPGQTSQVVTVTALNDGDTTNEEVVLTLSAGANYLTGAMNSATVTITPAVVSSVNFTWDGGPSGTGTTWNTAANWNPDGIPAAGDTAEIDWTNGTSVIADGASGVSGITLVTVRAGNTLGNGTRRLSNGGLLRNEGTIENALIFTPSGTVTNTGIIQANGAGKTMTFSVGGATINNSGGTIRAINGGKLDISYCTITNGQWFIDNSSTQLTSASSFTLNFNNVTVTNNGTVNLSQTAQGGARPFFFDLNTGAKYNNYGTINIVQSQTDNTGIGTKSVRMYVTNGASFYNASSGMLTISQLMTSNPSNSTYETYFRMDESGFTNNGTIIVTTLTNSVGTAQFRAPSVDFANAGTITVDGPLSSIQMSGRTLTQAAGLLEVRNGGSVVATNVVINGGTLAGNGSVTGDVALAGGVTRGWTYTNGVAGAMTISGTLTLAATATVAVTGGGDFPDPATVFTATSLAGAGSVAGWTVTGVSGYEAKIVGDSVVLIKPRGTVFRFR